MRKDYGMPAFLFPVGDFGWDFFGSQLISYAFSDKTLFSSQKAKAGWEKNPWFGKRHRVGDTGAVGNQEMD
jgi:hypothetical protein